MRMIDIHADDFGESVHASQDILECLGAGKLDSISILANMSCFERCVKIYRESEKEFRKVPKLSVHINVMEGSCLSKPEELSKLVDKEGHFCVSWEKIFMASYLPGRSVWKEQLKKEIRMQISAVLHSFPEAVPLRLDSHQHTHMIPVVRDAMLEVVREENWKVEYIRNAKEPILPFLKKTALYKTYRPVNFIKNIVLNYCSFLLEKRLKQNSIPPMYLWGLIMSGHMDQERIALLYPDIFEKAVKRGRKLEILFHPGQVQKEEITPEFSQKEAVAFHISHDREMEKKTVMILML